MKIHPDAGRRDEEHHRDLQDAEAAGAAPHQVPEHRRQRDADQRERNELAGLLDVPLEEQLRSHTRHPGQQHEQEYPAYPGEGFALFDTADHRGRQILAYGARPLTNPTCALDV